MKKVDAWVTSDGLVWTDRRAADHHAEERYGALLTSLAHDAVRVEKYTTMVDWLEANAARLRELDALRADRQLEPDGDDNE